MKKTKRAYAASEQQCWTTRGVPLLRSASLRLLSGWRSKRFLSLPNRSHAPLAHCRKNWDFMLLGNSNRPTHHWRRFGNWVERNDFFAIFDMKSNLTL